MLVKTSQTDKGLLSFESPYLVLPECHVLIIGITASFDVIVRVLLPGGIFQFTLSNTGGSTVLEVKRHTPAVISTSLSTLCDVINLVLITMVKD